MQLVRIGIAVAKAVDEVTSDVPITAEMSRLTGDVAAFLLSLHDAEPDFRLIGLPQAADFPAVRWKLINLDKLKQANPLKHKASAMRS